MNIKLINVYKYENIHIQDGIITYVGQNPPEFIADKVIDAAGDIALPAFYNAHAHLPMSLLRGQGEDLPLRRWLFEKIFPVEDKMDCEMAYIGALVSIVEMVKSGIAGISENYFYMDGVLRALKQSGVKALVSRSVVGQTLQEAAGRIQEADALFEQETNKIRAAYSLHSEYLCGLPVVQHIIDKANEKNVPIHVHVSETEAEHKQCIERHGKTPVALFKQMGAQKLIAAHCVWISDQDIELLRGSTIVHCPKSNLKLGSGMARVCDYIDAGVNVALGTDSAASNNNLNILEEMRLAALMQKGMHKDATRLNIETVINMATINGAVSMGFLNTGRIEEGYEADLILLNTKNERYHPLKNMDCHVVYSAQPSDVRLTMCGGEILYEDGKISFVDEQLLLKEFEDICNRILY